jgi:hypothetical protein
MLLPLIIAFFLQAGQPTEAVKNFDEWRSQQPDQTRFDDLYARYLKYLKDQGLSDEQINSARREIRAEEWNREYSKATRASTPIQTPLWWQW